MWGCISVRRRFLQRGPNWAIVIEVQADSGVAEQDSAKANSAVGPRNDLYIGLYYFEKTS